MKYCLFIFEVMSDTLFDNLIERLPSNNRLERIWKLAKIDFNRRYYNSLLGLFWALLNPIVSICIYFVVFTLIFPSNIENFAFHIFIGFIFWLSFTEETNKSFLIFRLKRYLIENIQFNKLDLYISSLLSTLFGFVFNLAAYIIISCIFQIWPTWYILWLPVILLNFALLLFGCSLILSSLSIFIKDLQMFWAIAILAGFWATPIFYEHEKLFELAPFMKWLNPMAGIIVNARRVLLEGVAPDMLLLLFNFLFAAVLIVWGLISFKKIGVYAVEKL